MTTEPRQEAERLLDAVAHPSDYLLLGGAAGHRARVVDALAAAIKVRDSHGGPPPRDAVEWTVNADALHELHSALSALREDET